MLLPDDEVGGAVTDIESALVLPLLPRPPPPPLLLFTSSKLMRLSRLSRSSSPLGWVAFIVELIIEDQIVIRGFISKRVRESCFKEPLGVKHAPHRWKDGQKGGP